MPPPTWRCHPARQPVGGARAPRRAPGRAAAGGRDGPHGRPQLRPRAAAGDPRPHARPRAARVGAGGRAGARRRRRHLHADHGRAGRPAARASRSRAGRSARCRSATAGRSAATSPPPRPPATALPPLYTADAVVELASTRGTRSVPVAELITGPKRTALAADELIVAFTLPAATGPQEFAKVGTRNAMVISVCAVSLALWPEERRVATCIGSAGPTPIAAVRRRRVHRRRARLGRARRALGRRARALRRARRPGRAADRRRPRHRRLPPPRGRRARAPDADLGLGTDAGVELSVNGERREVDGAWGGESLLYVLRERLGLPGSKNACEQGECGSCSVYLDGEVVCACLVLAAQAEGREVVTVEGLAPGGELHELQRAFVECGAVQCGFCTPGPDRREPRPAAARPRPGRGRHPRGARRQPLPLHRLREDHRRRPARRGAAAMSVVTPPLAPDVRRSGRIGDSPLRADGVPKVRGEFAYASDLRRRRDAVGRDAAQPASARPHHRARHRRRGRDAGRPRRPHPRRRARPQDLRARARRPARARLPGRPLQGRAGGDRRRRPPRDRAPRRGRDRRRVRGARAGDRPRGARWRRARRRCTRAATCCARS